MAERDEPREYPEYILPHSDFGDPECCGQFFPIERKEAADLTCNECGFVLKTVPMAELRSVRDELQGKLGFAIEKYPHSGQEIHFPTFSRMLAFICPACGESVNASKQ